MAQSSGRYLPRRWGLPQRSITARRPQQGPGSAGGVSARRGAASEATRELQLLCSRAGPAPSPRHTVNRAGAGRLAGRLAEEGSREPHPRPPCCGWTGRRRWARNPRPATMQGVGEKRAGRAGKGRRCHSGGHTGRCGGAMQAGNRMPSPRPALLSTPCVAARLFKDQGSIQAGEPCAAHILRHVQPRKACVCSGLKEHAVPGAACRDRCRRPQAGGPVDADGRRGTQPQAQHAPSSAARRMVSTGNKCRSSHSALRRRDHDAGRDVNTRDGAASWLTAHQLSISLAPGV